MIEKNIKKLLLIFPPQWTPISPHYALPSLIGQLKANGFSAQAFDLNIEFFNDILTKDNIEKSVQTTKLKYEKFKKKIPDIFSPNKTANDYTLDEQIILYKYNAIKKYIENHENYLVQIPLLVENAKNNLRNDNFYSPEILIRSLNVIDKALEIISLPYSPMKIGFEGVSNPFFKFNFQNINYFVNDQETNIFKEYYLKNISKIIDKHAEFIAISLNSSSQIISGLTLTKLLKERTKAHINIGGNFFGRIADELKNHPDFFDIYADSVSIEEGEGPIIEVAKFINGEIPIEKVPNFLFKKNGIVIKNDKMTPIKLDKMANLNLDDYNFSKYFTPKIVLPYQTSRGCYWGKCSFCDQDFGQNFNLKNSDKVINEIKELNEKYDITGFEFIDESVSPTYLQDFSNKLLSNNINIEFFCDARLETAFSQEILNNAYKAGLRMILWGLESGSRKVLELINKGIDLDKRFEILENAKNAGIWNFAFIFFGFPTETVEDAKMTVKMLVDKNDVIHSYGRSVFTMGRHAKLAQNPKKYGITKIYPAEEEFSPNINFDCIGMNKRELKTILDYCIQECAKAYKNPLWMYIRYREWLFLYICKYGVNRVKNFEVK